MKSKSFWCQIQTDFQIGQPILKSEFISKGKQRFLIATEKHIIVFKDNQFSIPKKYVPFDFDLKFEIIRTAPKLKGTCSPVKLSSNARPDQVKSESISKLGEIIALILLHDEENKYELKSDYQTLQEWRWFLGTKINQYGFHHLFKVFKKIGKGNFASVYLAERIEDGQQMAIKAFSKNIAYSEENGKEGLINEIKIMRLFNHPNIIKLYEVHETSNSLYICLELLEGGQLYEYLKKKVIFQHKEIVTIIRGLLEGLRHIHDQEIMHRDIKLENILFKKQNQIDSVVLADFGLATNVNESVYLYCRCGTPGFVAPEVINIKDLTTKYDKVCDIYSLGLVFHLLLTGKPAFQGRSYSTIVNQNKEAKINWKASIFEIIPKAGKSNLLTIALDLLRRMLEVDPKKRISAKDALKHQFFQGYFTTSDEESEIVDGEDSCKLDQKIQDLNQNFDKLRLNQLANSPIQSPNIRAIQTSTMKEGMQELEAEEKIVMHTPVITGRVESIDDSPCEKLKFQLKPEPKIKKHQRQDSLNFLQKLGSNQQQLQQVAQPLQQNSEEIIESKEPSIQQVKQSLSKNI